MHTYINLELDDLHNLHAFNTLDLMHAISGEAPDVEYLGVEEKADFQEALAFAEELERCADNYAAGVLVVSESYMVSFAAELAEDLGLVSEGWPSSFVDWDQAGDALKQDYSAVNFRGVTFYVR